MIGNIKVSSLSDNMNRLNFCTLFDTYYLSRGIALYQSLEAQESNFHLYIFAFNDQSYNILKSLNFKYATIISLGEFENEALLKVKPERSVGEYCWTCTSSTILFCLDNYRIDHCIYLDADLYFFNSPRPLIAEMGDESVMITEHRYTPKYDQSVISGKYCVQFMYFRNNDEARTCLNWWVNACLEWCFAIPEDGKFGDQKYLDDWTERFHGIHELQHLGGGVAPWNIQQYDFEIVDGTLTGKELSGVQKFDVIFFHFHMVNFYFNGEVDLGNYTLRNNDLRLFYQPYITHLEAIRKNLQTVENIDPHGTKKEVTFVRKKYRKLKRKLKGNYNRMLIKDLLNRIWQN